MDAQAPRPARERLFALLWRLRLSAYVLVGAALPPIAWGFEDPRGPVFGALGAAALTILGLNATARGQALCERLRGLRLVRALDSLLAPLLFLAIFLELGLSLAGAFSSSPLLRRDQLSAAELVQAQRCPPGVLYHGTPINSEGFYDKPLPQRPPGERELRALGIGDSFAVGIVPYEENFLTQAEALVTAGLDGSHCEVVNVGVGGVGPIEYQWLYDRYAPQLQPELVVLSVFVGNDLYESSRDVDRLHLDGYYLYTLSARLLKLYRSAGEEGLRALGSGELEALIGRFSDEGYLQLVRQKSVVFQRALKRRRRARIETALENIDRLLGTIREPVIVLLIPDELQVNAALRARFFEAFADLDPAAFDFEKPNREVAEVVARHPRARLIDATAALIAAEAEGPTYHPNDSHWNARGNRVAAGLLAPAILASRR